jgi:glycosyltransferase involved in cell wall biosynthesis
MQFVLLTCGLPGPAYHGGAVTCWAIVKAMLARGHKVTVLSLFDISDTNPYLESRDIQTKGLNDIGAEVEFMEYKYKELTGTDNPANLFSKTAKRIGSISSPQIERYFPWVRLKSSVQKKLQAIKPDALFAYHFDALSAVYDTNIAPIMAGVGDLWHWPGYFRLKATDSSIRKYLINYPYYFAFQNISKRLMLKMLRPCKKRGAFAAHYAEWLRNQRDFEDALYLRTPAHDPVGDRWYELREHYNNKRESKKFKILMIGDIGTAAKWGLRLLISEVLPVLEKRFGPEEFEIHLVGGGNIDHEFKILHELPYVKIRGRIVPPDAEFLSSDILFVPTPITLGIRVRIITGFSYGSCIVTHIANKTGIPEITHEGNALVSGTGAGLAEEIIRALLDESLRKRLEENARRTFEESFSEKTAAESIVMEIEKLT